MEPPPVRDFAREAHELALAHAPWLYRWFRRRAQSAADAEDLAQQALVVFLKNAPARRQPEQAAGYLLGIARRVLLDSARGSARRRARERRAAVPESFEDAPRDPDLDAALSELPEELELALTVVYARGLSYDRAAEVLGIGRSLLQSRVRSALARLRELLGAREGAT